MRVSVLCLQRPKERSFILTLTELDKAYIANTYARFPLELVSGKGAQLKSSDGKEYIDLGSGIAVNIFGIAIVRLAVLLLFAIANSSIQ